MGHMQGIRQQRTHFITVTFHCYYCDCTDDYGYSLLSNHITYRNHNE